MGIKGSINEIKHEREDLGGGGGGGCEPRTVARVRSQKYYTKRRRPPQK